VRKSFIVLLLISAVLLMSCSSGGEILDADIFIAAFEDEGLAISKVEYFTEENDPNELMGQRGQYIQKTNFTFTGTEVVEGCTVEIFKKEGDAKNREQYINDIIEKMPIMKHYVIRNANYVLRIEKAATTEEVEIFENVFNTLIDGESYNR